MIHAEAQTSTRLGLYLHWPYCTRICPYCDFNVYKDKEPDLVLWEQALTEDLTFWHEHTNGRRLESVYFGGGTPSLMPAQLVNKLIETCDRLWGFGSDPEITLEANPTDAETRRFADFAAAGINRLSLGIQSLRDEALQFLGRNHSATEAMHAVELATTIFPRTSLDLIYARPDQSLEDWQSELDQAIAHGVTHLSLYQLTVEPGTAFEKAVARKDWLPPAEDLQADFYDLTQDICGAHDLPAYEISNHAKAGDASRHNHLYWQYQDYIGIGPGAHGRVTLNGHKKTAEGVRKPAVYLSAPPERRYQLEEISPMDQGTEYLTMALRLKEGVYLTRYRTLSGTDLPETRMSDLQTNGYIDLEEDRLTLTQSGRKVLNRIVLELLG